MLKPDENTIFLDRILWSWAELLVDPEKPRFWVTSQERRLERDNRVHDASKSQPWQPNPVHCGARTWVLGSVLPH